MITREVSSAANEDEDEDVLVDLFKGNKKSSFIYLIDAVDEFFFY